MTFPDFTENPELRHHWRFRQEERDEVPFWQQPDFDEWIGQHAPDLPPTQIQPFDHVFFDHNKGVLTNQETPFRVYYDPKAQDITLAETSIPAIGTTMNRFPNVEETHLPIFGEMVDQAFGDWQELAYRAGPNIHNPEAVQGWTPQLPRGMTIDPQTGQIRSDHTEVDAMRAAYIGEQNLRAKAEAEVELQDVRARIAQLQSSPQLFTGGSAPARLGTPFSGRPEEEYTELTQLRVREHQLKGFLDGVYETMDEAAEQFPKYVFLQDHDGSLMAQVVDEEPHGVMGFFDRTIMLIQPVVEEVFVKVPLLRGAWNVLMAEIETMGGFLLSFPKAALWQRQYNRDRDNRKDELDAMVEALNVKVDEDTEYNYWFWNHVAAKKSALRVLDRIGAAISAASEQHEMGWKIINDPVADDYGGFSLNNEAYVAEVNRRAKLIERREEQRKVEELAILEGYISRQEEWSVNFDMDEQQLHEAGTADRERLIQLELERVTDSRESIDFHDHTYRYTEQMQPSEKDESEYQLTLATALADAAIQLGRPLTDYERFQISYKLADPFYEFMGEVVFDPLNLVPEFVMAKLIRAGGTGWRKVGQAVEAAPETVWYDMWSFFRKTANRATAYKLSAKVTEAATAIVRSGRDSWATFNDAFGKVLSGSMDPKALAKYNLSRRQIMHFFDPVKGVLTKLGGEVPWTPKQFMELVNGSYAEVFGRLDEQISSGVLKVTDEFGAIISNPSQQQIDAFKLRYLDDPKRIIPEIADQIRRTFLGSEYGMAWRGGPMADTFLGKIAKNMGIDVDPIKWATGSFTPAQRRVRAGIQAFLGGKQLFRKVWMGLILTARPGFTAYNYLDSAFRAVWGGADFYNHIADIHKMVAFWPEEIPTGFLAGLLGGEGRDVGHAIIEAAEQGRRMSMAEIWRVAAGELKGPRDIFRWYSDGIRGVNSAFETSFRMRLYAPIFNEEWAKVSARIYDDLLSNGYLEDDLARKIYNQLQIEAPYNPAKVQEYIKMLLESKKDPSSIFSFLYPEGMYEELAQIMGRPRARYFLDSLNNKLLVELGNAGELTDDAVKRILGEAREQIRDLELKVMRRANATPKQEAVPGKTAPDVDAHNIEDMIKPTDSAAVQDHKAAEALAEERTPSQVREAQARVQYSRATDHNVIDWVDEMQISPGRGLPAETQAVERVRMLYRQKLGDDVFVRVSYGDKLTGWVHVDDLPDGVDLSRLPYDHTIFGNPKRKMPPGLGGVKPNYEEIAEEFRLDLLKRSQKKGAQWFVDQMTEYGFTQDQLYDLANENSFVSEVAASVRGLNDETKKFVQEFKQIVERDRQAIQAAYEAGIYKTPPSDTHLVEYSVKLSDVEDPAEFLAALDGMGIDYDMTFNARLDPNQKVRVTLQHGVIDKLDEAAEYNIPGYVSFDRDKAVESLVNAHINDLKFAEAERAIPKSQTVPVNALEMDDEVSRMMREMNLSRDDALLLLQQKRKLEQAGANLNDVIEVTYYDDIENATVTRKLSVAEIQEQLFVLDSDRALTRRVGEIRRSILEFEAEGMLDEAMRNSGFRKEFNMVKSLDERYEALMNALESKYGDAVDEVFEAVTPIAMDIEAMDELSLKNPPPPSAEVGAAEATHTVNEPNHPYDGQTGKILDRGDGGWVRLEFENGETYWADTKRKPASVKKAEPVEEAVDLTKPIERRAGYQKFADGWQLKKVDGGWQVLDPDNNEVWIEYYVKDAKAKLDDLRVMSPDELKLYVADQNLAQVGVAPEAAPPEPFVWKTTRGSGIHVSEGTPLKIHKEDLMRGDREYAHYVIRTPEGNEIKSFERLKDAKAHIESLRAPEAAAEAGIEATVAARAAEAEAAVEQAVEEVKAVPEPDEATTAKAVKEEGIEELDQQVEAYMNSLLQEQERGFLSRLLGIGGGDPDIDENVTKAAAKRLSKEVADVREIARNAGMEVATDRATWGLIMERATALHAQGKLADEAYYYMVHFNDFAEAMASASGYYGFMFDFAQEGKETYGYWSRFWRTSSKTNQKRAALVGWNKSRAAMYQGRQAQLREMIDLFLNDNFDELARRFADPDAWLSKWDLLESAGWRVRYADNGSIDGLGHIDDPVFQSGIWVENEAVLRSFKKNFGVTTQVELEMPYRRSLNLKNPDHAKLLEKYPDLKLSDAVEARRSEMVIAAQTQATPEVQQKLRNAGLEVMDDNGLPLVDVSEADEAWEATLNSERFGKRFESFDEFDEYIRKQIKADIRAGREDMAAAKELRRQRITQTYEAQRAARKLAPPPYLLFEDSMIPHEVVRWFNEAEQAHTNRQKLISFVDRLEESIIGNDSVFLRPGQISDETATTLRNMADRLSQLQAEGLDAAVYGSEDFLGMSLRGAVSQVDKGMINYNDFTTFDQWIKGNVAPFWTFFSRTLPYWAEQFVMNPELVTFYMKYIEMSGGYAMEHRLVNSAGEPLPSTRGYLPVLGSTYWMNPLAPLSFRYAIPLFEEDYYDKYEGMSGISRAAHWTMDRMRMFGLNVSPMVNWLLYDTFDVLDENVLPRQGLVPQTKLFPPNVQRFLTSLFRRATLPVDSNLIDPDVSWKDFLIERELLVSVLRDLSMGREVDFNDVSNALAYRNQRGADGEYLYASAAEMYLKARDDLEQRDWWNNFQGYFTGIYPKQFTTAMADFQYMKLELAGLRASLNEVALRPILDVPADSREAWDFWKERRYTMPEGYVYSMYNIIRVYDPPDGMPIYGPERWEHIAKEVTKEVADRKFWNEFDRLMKIRDDGLSSLPAGATATQKAVFHDEFALSLAAIDTNGQFDPAKRPWFVGYKPRRLVWEDIEREMWSYIWNNKRQYNPSMETWTEYEAYEETFWEEVPVILQSAEKLWETYDSIQYLDDTIPITDIPGRLIEIANPDGWDAYRRKNHDILQAIDYVWSRNYMSEYFNRVDGLSGNELEMAIRDFHREFANSDLRDRAGDLGPSEAQVMAWIEAEYPGRFTREEMLEGLYGREIWDVEDRLRQRGREKIISQLNVTPEWADEFSTYVDDVWDLRNSVPPGGMGEVSDALIEGGVNPQFVDNFTAGDIDSIDMEEYRENMSLLEQTLEKQGVSGMDSLSDSEVANRALAEQENDAFKEHVDSQIYGGFMEERKMYYGLSLPRQAEYRKEHPTFAAALDDYKKIKCDWAAEHAVWSSYYYSEWQDKCSGGSSGSGGSGGRSGYYSRSGTASRSSGSQSSGLQIGKRVTWDVRELAKKPHMMGRGGAGSRLVWPRKLAEAAGQPLIDAVNSGEPLTATQNNLIESLKKMDDGKYEPFLRKIVESDDPTPYGKRPGI